MAGGFSNILRGKTYGGNLTVDKLTIGGETTKTATALAGAATLSTTSGVITSEALTTAAAAAYTLTLTNTKIAAADHMFAAVRNGTNTQGIPVVGRVTPAAGSATILIWNLHASEALNGTIKIDFMVVKN